MLGISLAIVMCVIWLFDFLVYANAMICCENLVDDRAW